MDVQPTELPSRTRIRDRVHLWLELIRANPTGRLALKLAVALFGGLVVAVGIVLIPLPGPGWLIVLLGLGIWAIEFVWARHLLHFTREKLRGWTAWIGRQSWPMRIAVGVAGLVLVVAVALTAMRYSLGIDIIDDVWTYITTH